MVKMPLRVPFLRCKLKIPPIFVHFLLIFCPFKSLSFYRQYFQISQGIIDGSNRTARNRLYFLFVSLLYFLLLNILQIVIPLTPELGLVFFNSARWLSSESDSKFFNIFYIFQTAMILYYYHLFYQGDNQKINRVMGDLIKEQPRPKTSKEHLVVLLALRRRQTAEEVIPSIGWCAINSLQPFILVNDVMTFMFLLQFELCLFREYGQYFTLSFLGALAYLSHLGHVFLALLFWYSFAHICILSGAYIVTIMAYLYLRLAQCKSLLRLSTLTRFRTDNVSLYRLIFTADQHYRNIFLVFCIVNLPFSAFISMLILLGKVHGQERFIILTLDIAETFACFFVHLLMAHFSQGVQQMGKQLAGLLGKKKVKVGRKFRYKLRLSLALSRLYTIRPYGITYGGLAVISLTTWTKCFLLYGKFLGYSFKILRH